jgi:pimeloyl-ACP methyl ester carboxylesterase
MVAAVSAAASGDLIDVDGVEIFVRRSEGSGPPVVFSHGNPGHSAEWLPFIERLERPAIAIDLPGWGRSAAPAGLDYSMHGLASVLGRALELLEVDRYALVAHDWGGLALIDALRHPQRLERLVVINAVPLLPGYRWHWIARWFWRRRLLGELFNLTASKPALRLISRQANVTPGPLPEEFIEMAWSAWPRGLRRPMLDLYRSGDPQRLAEAGRGLDSIACPSQVVWGVGDPYIDPSFGAAYAERLGAELVEFTDAGHWPWLDRPDLVDRVIEFLER